MEYIKLKELAGNEFKINSIEGYIYKLWDPQSKKMLFSKTWVQGYRKMWKIQTNRGVLDLSNSQLGQLCMSVMTPTGNVEVKGETFGVKSNGESGKEIRYFFTHIKQVEDYPQAEPPIESDIQDDSVPF